MSVRRVDQLLAGMVEGDAISQDALLMQAALRTLGFESDIFSDPERTDPRMADRCRPFATYRARPGDALVYHYGISSPVSEAHRRANTTKILRYHNVTPPDYFRGYDDALAHLLHRGREELAGLAAQSDAVWADSAFNSRDIPTGTCGIVRVFPLLFSPTRFERAPDATVFSRYGGPLRNILFVGRMVPNKRLEELILAFAWLQRKLDPFTRLVLAGSDRSCPRYYAMLRLLAAGIEMPHVCFEGFASEAGLVALYRQAQVFVTASDHEGYCLPLVEAMHNGVPVIAKAAGAMPETLGPAGVLYDGGSPEELASLMHLVLTDTKLRAEILAAQEQRMSAIRSRQPSTELQALLAELGLRP